VDWRIELPSQGLDITTSAVNNKSWQATLFPYWEGLVNASGAHQGQGYLEMTGY
jgi:predicted secreted hydrolase